MKKLIYLCIVLLLTASCTENIKQYRDDVILTEAQVLILQQTDTLQYQHAIVVDNYVLIFDDANQPKDEVLLVRAYDMPITVIFVVLIIGVLCVIIAGIIKLTE